MQDPKALINFWKEFSRKIDNKEQCELWACPSLFQILAILCSQRIMIRVIHMFGLSFCRLVDVYRSVNRAADVFNSSICLWDKGNMSLSVTKSFFFIIF